MNESIQNYPSYDKLKQMFSDDKIYQASDNELRGAVLGLIRGAETNESIRHHYIIMSNAIQSILLDRVLHELEKRNIRTQKLVIIVAIATLCVAVLNIFVSIIGQVMMCSAQ